MARAAREATSSFVAQRKGLGQTLRRTHAQTHVHMCTQTHVHSCAHAHRCTDTRDLDTRTHGHNTWKTVAQTQRRHAHTTHVCTSTPRHHIHVHSDTIIIRTQIHASQRRLHTQQTHLFAHVQTHKCTDTQLLRCTYTHTHTHTLVRVH